MNFTRAIINLIDHLPWLQGAPTDSVGDEPREDHPGTTFLDGPRRGPVAKSKGVQYNKTPVVVEKELYRVSSPS
jgi:hypothetical protein